MTISGQRNIMVDPDDLLLAMTRETFDGLVRNTLARFRGARAEDRMQLLSTELARTRLVTNILPVASDDIYLRWQALCFLLRWSLSTLNSLTAASDNWASLGGDALAVSVREATGNELAPEHSRSPTLDNERRLTFLALHHIYERDEALEKTAMALGISLAKLRSVRDEAVHQVADSLRMALAGEIPVEYLRDGFARSLYGDAPDAEKAIMEFLAVLDAPIARAELLDKVLDQASDAVLRLAGRGLIVMQDGARNVELCERLRKSVRTAMQEDRRIHWNQIAARHAMQQCRHVDAARHWRRAGNPVQAAQVLISAHEAIVDADEIVALYALARDLIAEGIDEPHGSFLRIASGQAAVRIADVPTALDWYRGVVSSPDLCLRAYAMYLSGKATQAINTAESQRYFTRGIELLTETDDTCRVLRTLRTDLSRSALLFDLYLGLAWLHIQELPNLVIAKVQLREAAAVLPAGDRLRETDLHNGWAGYFKEVGDEERVLDHRYRAWIAAQESGSPDLQLMTVHNLGQACIWNGQVEWGVNYVQVAIGLADRIGDRQRAGKCLQTMGVACFFQSRLEEAVTYYKEALELFRQTGNLNWMAWAHHDLAEAYAEMYRFALGRVHLLEAQVYAAEIGSGQLAAAVAELYRKYPGLCFDLDEREMEILAHVHAHGDITNRACVAVLSVSSRQANRLLQRLVHIGLLQSVGKGRAVRYELADL